MLESAVWQMLTPSLALRMASEILRIEVVNLLDMATEAASSLALLIRNPVDNCWIAVVCPI
jgi:hypothetical protein